MGKCIASARENWHYEQLFCGRKIYQSSLCYCLGQTLFINLLVNVLSLSIDFRLKKTELLLFPFVFHLYDVQSRTVISLKAVNGRKWRKTIHCGKTYALLLCCFKHSIWYYQVHLTQHVSFQHMHNDLVDFPFISTPLNLGLENRFIYSKRLAQQTYVFVHNAESFCHLLCFAIQ